LRIIAAKALVLIGTGEGSRDNPALGFLLEAFHDKDFEVRRAVVWALGDIGTRAREGLPVLTRALQDKNSLVRVSAAAVLVQMNVEVEKSVTVLIDALRPEDRDACLSAVNILGTMGPAAKKAVPALLALQHKAGTLDPFALPGAIQKALERIDPATADKQDR
jgi:HEAT repeat protein